MPSPHVIHAAHASTTLLSMTHGLPLLFLFAMTTPGRKPWRTAGSMSTPSYEELLARERVMQQARAKGGRARARTLTKSKRQRIARAAGKASGRARKRKARKGKKK